MWSQNKDENDRIRRQITKSSCQTTMAMKSDRNGRCDSVFIHIERLTSVPHWHIDFSQEDAKKVMCRDGAKTKMETKESNKTSTCHVKRSVDKQS